MHQVKSRDSAGCRGRVHELLSFALQPLPNLVLGLPEVHLLSSLATGTTRKGADAQMQNCVDYVQGVRGYPTIKALSPGSTMWAEYQGDRSAASLSNWATSLIGNAAVNIKKQSDLDSFLAKCGSSGSSSKGSKNDAAAASWGLCVVLSSDKSSMPSLWKALSQAFKGKVSVSYILLWAQAALHASV